MRRNLGFIGKMMMGRSIDCSKSLLGDFECATRGRGFDTVTRSAGGVV
jgi:hypothetical protein